MLSAALDSYSDVTNCTLLYKVKVHIRLAFMVHTHINLQQNWLYYTTSRAMVVMLYCTLVYATNRLP